MAAADADESQSRLPKQNTGGSDALWEHLLSNGSHGINGLWLIIQANSGRTHLSFDISPFSFSTVEIER
jgi:hypothetical protein